ncbi:MAG TPA: MBL fold metallo-hydrolase [Tissierellia bacterium]|nr:MBL fold metallo-hydrolase [Tissierellia bacterium]
MHKFKKANFIVLTIVILTILLSGCELESSENFQDNIGDLVVHYIDIGQGDSIFIQLPNGETSLIDGGPKANSNVVVNYLKEMKIEKVDYLIATHPHEDHIGGLSEVVKNFEIGKIYMPDKVANTAIFESLLKEIKAKDLKISVPSSGEYLIDTDDLKYQVLAPNGEKYENTNDYSIVSKITFKDNSFLFTGDAEKTSEKEMIGKGYDLTADVLKVGHHGSSTSTTEEFLLKVDPDYGVISLAKDNKYGHPHKEIIELLNKKGIDILRTDELGNIIIKSDGKDIEILNGYSKENSIKETVYEEENYIGNKNTKIYHSPDCGSLPKEENQIIFKSKEEAEKEGFKPHEKCIK